MSLTTFSVDRSSDIPLTDQVCEGLISAIHATSVPESQRLPSVRRLATRLGISQFTVSSAYERLASRGIVVSRAGAGYYVARLSKHLLLDETAAQPGQPDSAVTFVQNVVGPSLHTIAPGIGALPPEWMEGALPPGAVGKLLRGETSFSTPAPAQGLLELRKQLSVNLSAIDISAPPTQIITSTGVTHAIQLICKEFVQPGDAVMVEDPSNMVLHAQVRERGAKLLPVPRLADGPNLDVLERLASEQRPLLFFTQSVLHNPTGGNISATNCFRLLQLAEKYNFYIVEDDIFGDIQTTPVTRLASLDGFKRVLYVSSFTKLLSPAVRVGYIVSPQPFVNSLVERKILDVLSGSALLESLVVNALKSGRYKAHIDSLKRRLARVRPAALRALASMGIEVALPDSDGLFLWGHVPRQVMVDRLVDEGFQQGILLTKGSMFSPTGSYDRHFRFNVAHCTDARVIDLLRRQCQPSMAAGATGAAAQAAASATA